MLLVPTSLIVLSYLVWSAALLLRPLPARPSAYTYYLRSEYASLRQQLRQNELAILAVQARQRKLELDLLQAQYTRAGKVPSLPPVTRHMIGATQR